MTVIFLCFPQHTSSSWSQSFCISQSWKFFPPSSTSCRSQLQCHLLRGAFLGHTVQRNLVCHLLGFLKQTGRSLGPLVSNQPHFCLLYILTSDHRFYLKMRKKASITRCGEMEGSESEQWCLGYRPNHPGSLLKTHKCPGCSPTL